MSAEDPKNYRKELRVAPAVLAEYAREAIQRAASNPYREAYYGTPTAVYVDGSVTFKDGDVRCDIDTRGRLTFTNRAFGTAN